MARFSLVLLLAAFAFIHISDGMSFQELLRQVFEEEAYDNFIIKYKWIPSICKEINCKNMPLNGIKKEWTINYLKGYKNNIIEGPENCEGTYNMENINNILKEKMKNNWSTYKRDMTNNKYWKNIYKKYGTCINDNEEFNTEIKYFENTIKIYKEINIKQTLNEYIEEIKPSNTKTYKLIKFKNAIKNLYNVEPAFNCIEKDNKQYISEISICYTKKLIKKNCNNYIENIKQCDPNKNINYPKFPPPGFGF